MRFTIHKRLSAVIALGLAAVAWGPGIPAHAQTFGGNELLSWSVSGAPSSGLSSTTFPITVAPATARRAGTYFAMQFGFTGQTELGYTGLQPRPDANGSGRLRGVFSSFIPGTTSSDRNCTPGADGGPGVSCGLEFNAVYGHTYNMVVSQTGTNTWSGSAVDTVTGTSTHIGSYTLPAGSGNLKPSQSGFIEYYDVPSCSQQQKYDVTFGAPSSGSLTGAVSWVKEYGDCLGQGGTTVTPVGTGVRITRGTVG
ncbi:DUF3472 domain-containing protein [Arthrobacter sp. NPDC090010]|uniref:DUF3472 domain-containing protein n=1 Tax=Arthrobacter sp. NPDC090010 TaxID=3363942 RepID=UPI0038215632